MIRQTARSARQFCAARYAFVSKLWITCLRRAEKGGGFCEFREFRQFRQFDSF